MSTEDKSDKTIHVRSCRVCLDSKCLNTVMIEEQNGWLQLFEYCFGLSLSSDDEPRILCKQCACNVKSFSEFKKQCHISDKLWKSIKLNNVTCTPEKTEFLKCESSENEQIIKDCNNFKPNNDIKPIINYFYNDNSMQDDNDEIINDDRNEINLLSEIDNSDISLNNKEEHGLSSSKVNKREHSNQIPVTKVKDLLKCGSCEKGYASQLWYLRHMKLCKGKSQEESLNSFNEVHIGTDLCSHVYPKALKPNAIKKEPKLLIYFCDTNENVEKHLDEHWTNNDLQCKLCEFMGKDQAALAAHRYVHSTAKYSSFTCHICHEKTRSLLTLQFHYRKVHLNKSGGLCSQPHCNKVYNSWRLWKSHEKLHNHPGYVCDICGQKYRHRHLIIEHLINHTNPPSHVCDVCGKTFLRLRNLRVHIENVHTKPDPIKCNHCNRMFKNQHYLRVHQRREAMDKVWKCEFCPMEYPMLSELNAHMRSHSDERPFCCHICGSRFKAKGPLKVHMRNHTGCRPFKCLQCSKAFTSSAQLKTHNIVHTGILPYKCAHCEKSFRCKKRMMKHCALSHKALTIVTR